MNEDNIVEMATHEELLQIESRMYKTLYDMRLKKRSKCINYVCDIIILKEYKKVVLKSTVTIEIKLKQKFLKSNTISSDYYK